MELKSNSMKVLREESFAVAVDAHTAGEPIRVILQGFPEELEDQPTMVDRQEWLEENHDKFRTRTMQEPRGHSAMFGAIVMEPAVAEADVGVLFPYPAGYADMCGHGSLGVATVLVELGLIEIEKSGKGEEEVILDTPAGLVKTVAHYNDGNVEAVDLFGTPSYFLRSVRLEVGQQKIEVALSYGGNFFGIVKVEQFGLNVTPEDLEKLNSLAHDIMKRLNERDDIKLVHPQTGELPLERIRFVEGESSKTNVVIHEGAVIDRSPCGTGTCSQIAWEYFQGEMRLGERKNYESITGSRFRGEAVEESSLDGHRAVVPKLTGSSHITGLNYFIASQDDPFINGFSLSLT